MNKLQHALRANVHAKEKKHIAREKYLRRQKLRSCPLVRATILGTQETVFRALCLTDRTRIRQLFLIPFCLRTVVPFRGTVIVRPSSRPETNLASRPSPRGRPIFSRSRWASLNVSWGFRDGNTFTSRIAGNGVKKSIRSLMGPAPRKLKLAARKLCSRTLAIEFPVWRLHFDLDLLGILL